MARVAAGAAGAAAQGGPHSLTSASALRKRLVQAAAPRQQAYPAWLDGRWALSLRFVRAQFPFAEADPAFQKRLLRTASVPGFKKLSIAATPDVGAEATARGMRFAGGRADASFNITEAIESGMGPGAVSVLGVEQGGANRMTVRLKGVPGAERIELFTNARASATRDAVGAGGAFSGRATETFEASETLRQVTLGYSSQYGRAREDVGDYTHVWSFTRPVAGGLEPAEGAEGAEGDAALRVQLTTAAYLQPTEALSLTSPGGSAPDASRLLDITSQPVVIYRHTGTMTRVG